LPSRGTCQGYSVPSEQSVPPVLHRGLPPLHELCFIDRARLHARGLLTDTLAFLV
jgi:hypothetical protein